MSTRQHPAPFDPDEAERLNREAAELGRKARALRDLAAAIQRPAETLIWTAESAPTSVVRWQAGR